jgi:transposase
MAGRRLDALTLTEAEKSELTTMASRPKTAQASAQRIILTCADGLENKAVARLLDVHSMTATVGKWRRRFLAQRVEGLRGDPRLGAPRTIEG